MSVSRPAAYRPAPSLWARKSVQRTVGRLVLYPVLVGGAVILLLPLAWLLSSSLKPLGLIFVVPPQWIPSPIRWQNYVEVWQAIPMALFARNTITITFFAVLGTVASASIVAFGFARLRFRMRDVLFLVLLSTMMIPGQVTLIPQYILFRTLRWLNSFLPLIVPSYFGGGAFNVFLLRQFYMTLPLELDDAARIDGCSTFQIYRRIILPQSKPALGVVAIFGFMGHWNEFFAPLIYLNSTEKYTLALGLNFFRSVEYSAWHLLMAASLMTALPCIVVYFLAQRYFIQGIVFTGIKG
ncbi:MAG: carbohydrate ABC transporter permease [Anaerolineae bacterium]|nr:carbohydrate ABC transporter permease [Anaerolineae bacterium]